MQPDVVYKLLTDEQFLELGRGDFAGAPVDVADGYVHLSTALQVAETAAKWFRAVSPLWLVEIDLAAVDADVRWEPSRGGALFPHLYGRLGPGAAKRWWRLEVADDGAPVIPGL